MKTKTKHILFASVVLYIFTVACGFSFSTAKINNAFMVRQTAEGLEQVSVFQPDEVFICFVELANAPDDTLVNAAWYAEDIEGEQSNFLIDEASITTGENEVFFDLSNNILWPSGTYRVDIFLNEELSQSIAFQVQ